MGLTARATGRGGAIIVFALALGLAVWRWADVDPVTAKLEGALLDLRFRLRGPLPPPESVVIVAIDDRAVARTGAYEPLRAALAQALETIGRARPRVVALDLILADRTDADAALASAISGETPVLLAVAVTGHARRPGGFGPAQEAALTRSAVPVVLGSAPTDVQEPELVLPTESLAAAALLAHTNVVPEPDGSVRRVPLSIRVDADRLLPAMALTAARYGLGAERGDLVHRLGGTFRIGAQTIPTDRRGNLLLDHYGPGGRIPTVGLLDVLDGRTGSTAFAGRVVFVGGTAASLRDEFSTPFGAVVPGVELHATAAANMIENRILARNGLTFGLTALLGAAAALLVLAAFRLRRIAVAMAAVLACWGASLIALQAAFAQAGLWLDGISALGGLAIGTAVGGWSRLGREHRGRENLAHYIAPSLAGQLAETAHPAFDGREQTVGLLFVDVSGYSGLVESQRPAEIAVFLRELHRLFEHAAERHGGVIVDFQGDGAFLVFGLPDPSSSDAADALACAETLLAGSGRVRAAFLAGPVRLRVSVHWGPVACAVLGGERQAQVSVTGDAVNVTSRLQEFAKAQNVPFVATRAALDAAGTTHGMRPLGREPLRGRRGEIEIWGRAAEGNPAAAS